MKDKIADLLNEATNLDKDEILKIIESPPDPKMGDYSFPCFNLAKMFKKNPSEISKDIAKKIGSQEEFEKVEAVGPYVNFFVNRNLLARAVLAEIQKKGDKFGNSNAGKNRQIVIDMSSPNIAKPFGIGHLRSTIIGNSIAKLSLSQGFKPVKINYLGDWGTQFGKLIVGYKEKGDDKKLKKDPVKHLLELYVEGNKEKYEDKAREWFKKLEDGDKESLSLWKKFKQYSIEDFDRIYSLLNIKFDVISGESFYNKKLDSIVKELEQKKLLKSSEGALIVDLKEYGLGVCLIRKEDGTTLYATRDLAAAIERYEKYKFDKMFYEVGSEQNLHFRQVFKVLELMGYKWAKNLTHIDHGLYLDEKGKKFATRKGKTVFMSDILEETISLAKKEILQREKVSAAELEKRAHAIALAAILYGDLKNHRSNNVVFDIERFLSFEGDTGPYLLYAYARARSILRKAKYKPKKEYSIIRLNDLEKNLVFQIGNFPSIVSHAYENLSPNIVANYAYQLCQSFNEFYHDDKVIGSDDEQFRLILVDSFSQVLKNALFLLGISVIEKM